MIVFCLMVGVFLPCFHSSVNLSPSKTAPYKDTHFTPANISPESSLLARIFVEHCSKSGLGLEAKLENARLPVVSAFAYYLQGGFEVLFRGIGAMHGGKEGEEDEDEEEEEEEEMVKREVVIGNLLKLILCLDYTDEIGRRKVFGVVSEFFLPPFPFCGSPETHTTQPLS